MLKRLKWFLFRLVRPTHLVGVFVVVIQHDRVLLIKKRLGVVMGWQIPGGGLEPGKTLEENAKDELLQETGIEVSYLRLVDANNMPEYRNVGVTYLGRGIVGNTDPCPRDYIEIAEARWVPISKAKHILIPIHRDVLEKAIHVSSTLP